MDRPNLVLVNLDDARFDALDRMPTLRDRIRSHAVIFRNGFAPTAVCNPSRASLLTGLSAFRHRIRSQTGPMGSAEVFRERGLDHRTIAVWLQTAGYSTGLFGKYLNGYWEKTEAGLGPGGAFYVPPGWDRWQALVVASKYGGRDGESYQVVDETGRLTRFEDHTTDDEYHTDQSGAALRAFVRSSIARGRPFFAYWAPNAPHTGPSDLPVPARRHRDIFADLPPWRPLSWNEPDVSDKPRWVQLIEASA
ncbi:MAG: sulfatase-like hydrolase/transferase, partial [SAR324 cluster bacterium]|nr:sulfatase-like hydrolase/transferase [SAR324 cluster bacterium]